MLKRRGLEGGKRGFLFYFIFGCKEPRTDWGGPAGTGWLCQGKVSQGGVPAHLSHRKVRNPLIENLDILRFYSVVEWIIFIRSGGFQRERISLLGLTKRVRKTDALSGSPALRQNWNQSAPCSAAHRWETLVPGLTSPRQLSRQFEQRAMGFWARQRRDVSKERGDRVNSVKQRAVQGSRICWIHTFYLQLLCMYIHTHTHIYLLESISGCKVSWGWLLSFAGIKEQHACCSGKRQENAGSKGHFCLLSRGVGPHHRYSSK